MASHGARTAGELDLQLETLWSKVPVYEQWVESLGVPLYTDYYVPDLRTLELGDWPERECKVAFLQLAGQQGISEARVTEIAPGQKLPPLKFALDEVVYVVEGRGVTTVWTGGDDAPRTFEWGAHSLFLLPRHSRHQISNTSGTDRVLLLHYNYLPLAVGVAFEPGFFFENSYEPRRPEGDLYEAARAVKRTTPRGESVLWYGNFFPDMSVWDKTKPMRGRGAGGHSVSIQFPVSPIYSHMSVFPSGRYKKAHRHGPGVLIVIPRGEGFSVMWEEGQEKVFIPWHEASVFVPPNRWFHQHFNVGVEPARYLAFHAPVATRHRSERVEDIARDQIEYADEDPRIRERFEAELAERGMQSLMPDEAYRDHDYVWDYEEDQD